MHLRSLFVLMSALLLSTQTISTFAQAPLRKTLVPSRNSAEDRNSTHEVLFKSSGTGKPLPTRGTGSRNDRHCPQDTSRSEQTLMALVPPNQFGLTWVEHPTVWVYLPKTSARQMLLSVKVEGFQQRSQRFLPITGEAGILGIPFAENSPPLEIGVIEAKLRPGAISHGQELKGCFSTSDS